MRLSETFAGIPLNLPFWEENLFHNHEASFAVVNVHVKFQHFRNDFQMDEGGTSGWHFNGCALCLTGELALLGRNFHNHSTPYATITLDHSTGFFESK